MRLVLLSTSGNQSYIFASNRLREAISASYLLASSTTDWIDEACATVAGTRRLQSSSGNALLITPDQDAARQLVQLVTRRVLINAPGLSLTGVSVEIEGETPTADDITRVFGELRKHSGRTLSATAARFQRLPVVAACQSTGGPASAWYSDIDPAGSDVPEDQNPIPQSAEVIAKRSARLEATRRMERLAGKGVKLLPIGEFFTKVDWVGVIHADGNRLGQLFRNAAARLDDLSGTDGVKALGQLSSEVRNRAESALRHAVATVAKGRKDKLPFVPLIVGGDDLTVLIDGTLALEFTTAYLSAFGEPAAEGSVLRRVLGDQKGLTACAGVALVKRRFPFSEAYRLADELCSKAKQRVSDGQHGMDVHVLLDSQARSLQKIRDTLTADGRLLTDRPYLLPADNDVTVPARHDWRQVQARIRTVWKRSPDGAVVTPAQLHHLRKELRTDSELARRRLAMLRERATCDDDLKRLEALCSDGEQSLTGLYDILELGPFVGGNR